MLLSSAAELVAHYLRAQGYDQTLRSFISEANLPPDAGTDFGNKATLEQILQEKKTFDVSLSFEKLGVDDDHGWQKPAPSTATVLEALPTKSNILSVHVLQLVAPGETDSTQCIAVTTADRRISLIKALAPTFPIAHSYATNQDSPLLDVLTIDGKYLLMGSMSGRLLLHDMASDKTLEERKDHSKYLVKLSCWSSNGSIFIASAGWDAKVVVYQLERTQGLRLGKPIAILNLPSIPETVLFVQGPDPNLPILLLTRRDSTFLYYYALHTSPEGEPRLLSIGKQNLAPHSNAWIAFSPSDVQPCPTDPSIVAVATSSTPHMKLLVVRLLVPPTPAPAMDASAHRAEASADLISDDNVTQASQARAALALQDKEESAILINVTTMAPQTNYSTPKVVWRPDGTGLWVNADDGCIRGFEATTGKLIASLTAHDAGSKIRCLWSGYLGREATSGPADDRTTRKEHLVSGGFDQKLVLWGSG
ncbi:hypothetical protein K491DRAFT_606215 [Lophiostoma macrostomum CBS 122681]|uniref:Uncharacterized protein n=1 Tax=Lophiostoma macrostomum CBS 122681 TaxID=1314788 RepID=A0A6A6SXR4_9PLEO|nr:hypothetical protein K491DRAFT_606215 [Lophiostoma macrostomum CBS 122681]